ncbi:hypothetical protein D3C86_1608220 [compost metagenome]
MRTGIGAAENVDTQIAGRKLAALVDLDGAFSHGAAVLDLPRPVLGIGHHVAVIAREQVLSVAVGSIGKAKQCLTRALERRGQGLPIGIGQHPARLDDPSASLLQGILDGLQRIALLPQIGVGRVAVHRVRRVDALRLRDSNGQRCAQGIIRWA